MPSALTKTAILQSVHYKRIERETNEKQKGFEVAQNEYRLVDRLGASKGGAWTRFVGNWKPQVRMKFSRTFCLFSLVVLFSVFLDPLLWQSAHELRRRTCALRAAPVDCVGKACGEVSVICTRCCIVLEKSTHA